MTETPLPSTASDRGIYFQRCLRPITQGRLAFVLAILFATLSVAFAGYRATSRYSEPTGEFDFAKSGMSDFHNGAYYPSIAFRNGINPYSVEVCESYPMARSTPPYSPVVFLLYLPFSYLTLPAADIAFFSFNVLLMAGLSMMIIKLIRQAITVREDQHGISGALLNWFSNDALAMIWLFGWMMFSRPGHITLFTGYFTLQLVIGTLMAFHWGSGSTRSSAFLSGVGMLLASGKPTYILPLAMLMFFRRNWRSLFVGILICGIVAGAGLTWLATFSSYSEVIQGVAEGQQAFDDDPTEFPVNTWTRLDLMGVIAKVMAWKPSGKVYLAAMVAMLLPIGWVIWRVNGLDESSRHDHNGLGLTACIGYLALLISIYHHSYDGLLASLVWASALLGGSATLPLGRIQRIGLVGSLTIPAVNYVATLRFRDLLGVDNQSPIWNVVVSTNGVCLVIALGVLVWAALRRGKQKGTG